MCIIAMLQRMCYNLTMQFELTDALIDDILFAMEDQYGEFFLDTVEGVVAGGMEGLESYLEEEEEDIDIEDSSRFISLPEWDSSSGFRLMERFAAGLKNPLIREELSSALGRGRKVFRAFKDALNHYPEAEKLWFAFKEKEMRNEVIRWYNGLREEWGLEKIGVEPEDTDDLVLEDFRFRPFREDDLVKAEVLHDLSREECMRNLSESGMKPFAKTIMRESHAFHYLSNNLFNEIPALPLVHAMSAESGGGDFAAYISGIVEDSVLYIQNLEVRAEYRGLGIGEALLIRFLESFDSDEVGQVLMDLPSWAEDFSRVLLRESFKPYTVRYCLNLRDRN